MLESRSWGDWCRSIIGTGSKGSAIMVSWGQKLAARMENMSVVLCMEEEGHAVGLEDSLVTHLRKLGMDVRDMAAAEGPEDSLALATPFMVMLLSMSVRGTAEQGMWCTGTCSFLA